MSKPTKEEEEIAQSKLADHDENDAIDSGFGTSFNSSTIRMMNRDGSVNVNIKGLSKLREFNLYKQLIKLSTFQFYSFTLLLYIFINSIFAWIYFLVGLEGLNANANRLTWWDAFFFSTQTFTTVGFGHISPNSMFTNIVSSTEAFIGLLFFAIATGLVYGRFSNSRANIQFSNKMIIQQEEDENSLMVRLTNVSSTDLSDLKAQIIMSFITSGPNGKPIRRYKNLKLELEHISLMTTSWTIVHKITPDSPCKLLNDSSGIVGVEFMLFISAFDEVFDQLIKVRTSYTSEDVIENARFIPITSYNEESIIVDLDKLSEYELVDNNSTSSSNI